jgi:protein-tyrosine phosphatase
MKKIRVLFVCMGNICRSPTAQGVFAKKIADHGIEHCFMLDSAGTHAYHVNEAPDLRAQKAAKARDIDLSGQRARKVVFGDFEDFDYIVAMDDDNYHLLSEACPDEYKSKLYYFLEFAPHLKTKQVPDPYYGGSYGFERVLDMVEEASEGFVDFLKAKGEIQ